MVWKKEVSEHEILSEASQNTAFWNINIDKQKLYQQQVLISASSTEAAAPGPTQDKVLWTLSAAIPFLHLFSVCKKQFIFLIWKRKLSCFRNYKLN